MVRQGHCHMAELQGRQTTVRLYINRVPAIALKGPKYLTVG